MKNLNKTYKDFSLQDISFSVPKGSVMGFVGENGAGKTTTLKPTSSCEVLFIKFKSVTGICSSACVFHNRLVENMLQLIAEKNI
ncbi:ATP-binding cassette domain-containing protein, partial [Clostridioides difficile]|uniref:ATP-binding cassette domain-containing protein n=1 Tax=Clostridioides difficile TaxID=1496 RepID=UPI003F8D0992